MVFSITITIWFPTLSNTKKIVQDAWKFQSEFKEPCIIRYNGAYLHKLLCKVLCGNILIINKLQSCGFFTYDN